MLGPIGGKNRADLIERVKGIWEREGRATSA